MALKDNLQNIHEKINAAAKRSGRDGDLVTLVAVSKRKPLDAIKEAMADGQKCFGENYLQDALEKIEQLPHAKWHFIGRIQSNKCKLIAQNFDVVETVDRLKVAKALEKNLSELGKTMSAYIQVNIGKEEQKAGILPEDLEDLVKECNGFSHLELKGLMTIPPYSDNPEKTRRYFKELHQLADSLETKKLVNSPFGLSMGMSGDFEIAVEEGATLVRVGTAIFGERD